MKKEGKKANRIFNGVTYTMRNIHGWNCRFIAHDIYGHILQSVFIQICDTDAYWH